MAWGEDQSDETIEVIKQYCEEDGIKYRQVGERAIHAGFQGRNFSYQLVARSREGHRQALFTSMVPVKIQPEQRPVVAEFLCRANFGLVLGNFEFDYETGGVGYKTSVDVEGGELTSRMVKTQFEVNLATVDKYAKGLIGILYRELTPVQAIAEIEEVSAVKRLAAQAALN